METTTKIVPNNFNVFCYGDLHVGSLHFCKPSLDKLINIIESEYDGIPEKHNYCVNQGDNIEAIAPDDKRFDLQSSDTVMDGTVKGNYIDRQIDYAVKLQKPIRRKIITLLKGNHENTLLRYTNPAKRIADKLKVKYGTFMSVIEYRDKDGGLLFKHYATHGRKQVGSTSPDPVRKIANMQIQLMNHMAPMFGDTLLNTKGHIHKIIISKPIPQLFLTTSGKTVKHHYTEPKRATGYIEPFHKWYASTGSIMRLFLHGIDGYGERAEYPPVELGCCVAKIRNRQLIDLVKVTL